RRRCLRGGAVRAGPRRTKRRPGHGGPHAPRALQAVTRAMPRRLSAALLLIGLLAACSSARPAPAAAPDLGHGLAAKVSVERMFGHLRALQDIANANNGNRADGTPGYDASVEYVVKVLRGKGFEVSTPQFDRLY